jgi:hypothetical protein
VGSRPERGAYGNARGKERQKKRREQRLADPRVANALAEVREHQAKIDEAIEAGRVGTGRPVLTYTKEITESDMEALKDSMKDVSGKVIVLPDHPDYQFSTSLNITWTLKDAYLMIHQGYTLTYIAKRTGYDYDLIIDLVCDLSDEEGEDDAPVE